MIKKYIILFLFISISYSQILDKIDSNAFISVTRLLYFLRFRSLLEPKTLFNNEFKLGILLNYSFIFKHHVGTQS